MARTPKEASPALARRTNRKALVRLGLPLEQIADSRIRSTVRAADEYRRQRVAELAELHGEVSAGVAARLADEALAMAASRLLYEDAFDAPQHPEYLENGKPACLTRADLIGRAGRSAAVAQGQAREAWTLASAEAAARRALRETDDSRHLADVLAEPVEAPAHPMGDPAPLSPDQPPPGGPLAGGPIAPAPSTTVSNPTEDPQGTP